ncbi:BTAD domain-containing putative transcriptional regulator [Catellatospora coxensis]
MLEVGVLGPLVVERSGEPVAIPGGRARKLFGFLLIHAGSAHSVEMLTDLLWDGHPPRTASTALHGYVSRLRKALGGEVLHTAAGGYQLALEPEQTDSGRFVALTGVAQASPDELRRSALLRQALAMWRGPALDTYRFEHFAQAEIAALEERRLCAVEEAIEADLNLGRHGALVPELQRLVRRHPQRERFWAQLMLALYRAGRQVDALAAYRRARSWMAEELGIEPGPQLRWLEQAVLRQDAGLVGESPAGSAGGVRRPPILVPRSLPCCPGGYAAWRRMSGPSWSARRWWGANSPRRRYGRWYRSRLTLMWSASCGVCRRAGS